MAKISEQLNQEQLQNLGKAKEKLAKEGKKRMYQLFEKLSRMMHDRKVKYTKADGRIECVIIDGHEYVPTVKDGNMMFFSLDELVEKHKTLIDGEQFFPGIND